MTVVIDTRKGGAESASAHAKAKGHIPGDKLYKPREPIYPKLVHGQWRRIKWALLILLLGVYYVTPWIRWDRPGSLPDQAVLADFAGRRFYFFTLQLWPQEVYFITGLLVMSALALFLVTALFGRLWCGYACPQTVWTDLFIYVERLFEGDRNARMRLDAAPMSFNKLWRKTGKHLTWLLIGFSTGGAWIFYFHDAPSLLKTFWIGQAPATAYIFCAMLTLTTYIFAGTMREQVCTYMCPWPRIQGAMLDDNSLQVTYRRDRGEPRGAHKKGADWAGRGDCVDCKACVVACPMGIDIRDGAQLECINCALCIDACDDIMVKVGRPKALIAYDTDAAVLARENGQKPIYRFVRSRTIYYSVALVIVSALMVWGLTHRHSVELHALHDRNPLFVTLHDGAVRNGYTLKIANHSFQDQTVKVTFEGPKGALFKTPGQPVATRDLEAFVPANQVRAIRVFVTVPADSATASSMPASFDVQMGQEKRTIATTFLTGAPASQ